MIKDFIKLRILRLKWKKKNKNNQTAPGNIFNIQNVSVGSGTYGRINALTFNETNRLTIGNYCSIGPNVMFIVSADHFSNHISTYPFLAKFCGEVAEGVSKGDIVVEDDVWIGYGATIMSGVKIGQGAIIAAGAVVSKDVPPYAIAGGVPARVIKYRFAPEMIEALMKVDYSKLTPEQIKQNIDDLYTELENPHQLDWMPQKG